MAPPAKLSMTGSSTSDTAPKAKPIHTPTTSSKPMPMEMTKVRNGFTPAMMRGAMMTIPSGTFCRAMPRLTVQPPESKSLMLTPAAMPSGSLCMAMAITKRSTLLSLALW